MDVPFIKVYRPESADSSSWMMALRYGQIRLWTGAKYEQQRRRWFQEQRPSREVIERICNLGFTYQTVRDLAKDESWVFHGRYPSGNSLKGTAQAVCTASYLRSTHDLESRYGTKVYAACTKAQVESLITCYLKMRESHVL